MNKIRITLSHVRLIYIATTIVLLALGVSAYNQSKKLSDLSISASHTSDISLELEKLIGAVKDAETGQRGYLLTHDSSFLEPYYYGVKKYYLHEENVKQLTIDDSTQQKNFKQLTNLAQNRIERLAKILAISKERMITVNELLIEKYIMDNLRIKVSDMMVLESNMLREKQKKINITSVLTPLFIIVLFIGALVVLFASYFRLNNAIHETRKLSKALKEIVMEANSATCLLRGPKHYIELANKSYLSLVNDKDICYKYIKEALPELASTDFFDILDKVYKTGISIEKKNVVINVSGNNKPCENRLFNFTYSATQDENYKRDGVVINAVDVTQQTETLRLIEESHIKYEKLINNLPVAVYTCDEEGYIQLFNEAAVNLWGRTPEIGKDMWCGSLKIYKTDGTPLPLNDCPMAIALKKGQVIKMEIIIERPDGTKRSIIPNPQPIYDCNNNICGAINTLVDITDQVKARTELEVKEEQLRIAIIGGELGTFDYYTQTGELIWSDKTKEIFGLLAEDKLNYETYLQSVHPDDKENFKAVENTINQPNSNDMYEIEYRILSSKDGKLKWVRSKGKTTKNANETITRITGVIQDITQQKLATQIAEDNEKRFRDLAQALPQLIWVTDEKGASLFTSLRWEEYTGIKPSGIKEWQAIVHPDDFENINEAWAQCLSTGNLYKHEVRLLSKTGNYYWYRVIGEPVRDENNKIINWVGAFTEINDEKIFSLELESLVKERTNELFEKNTTLEKVNNKLQLFAHISSHDLQEPLRKVRMSISRILEKDFDTLSDKSKEHFNRVQDAAIAMQNLIGDLQTYSITNNKQNDFEVTDLNLILQEVIEGLKDRIEEKNAIIESGDLCEVNILPFEFRQLMHNLIGNSLKFSVPDIPPYIIIKSISSYGHQLNNLDLLPYEKYCYISICDNGIGFESSYSEKIFEPFQRLHGKEKYKGSGIGLAIAKKIVEIHNGIITAKGELGKGTIIEIYIPTDKVN